MTSPLEQAIAEVADASEWDLPLDLKQRLVGIELEDVR